MKKYISMISFVIIMGLVSVGLLIGADFITRDKIAANAELTWKSAMLTHHEVPHSSANFVQLFNETFTKEDKTTSDGQVLTVYVNKETKKSSLQFTGNGLWDVITGVMTLEPDFNTIVAITVTKQGETPGLGGIVAEKPYLDKYVGKYFDETLGLVITKNPPQQGYEVEAITGATGTSNMFGGILNVTYNQFNALFGSGDPQAALKKTILTQNNIEFTNDNYNALLVENFDILTEGDLVAYRNKNNNFTTYQFVTEGLNANIVAVITLGADFKTIQKVNVLSNAEGWGAVIQTKPEVLAVLEGKVFTATGLTSNPLTDVNVDDFAGATTTQKKFFAGLNSNYILYAEAFGDIEDGGNTDTPDQNEAYADPLKQTILEHNQIENTNQNYETVFTENIITKTVNNLVSYINKTNGNLSYQVELVTPNGKITKVVTLKSDIVSVINVTEIINEYKFKDYPTYQTDMATVQRLENEAYDNYKHSYHIPTLTMTGLMTQEGISFTRTDYQTVFNNNFVTSTLNGKTFYTHQDGVVSYVFGYTGFQGLTTSVLLSLESDFVTINDVTVLFHGERRASTIQTNQQFFDAYIGKKFIADIVLMAEPVQPNEILDGFAGVTMTRDAFLEALNKEYYNHKVSYDQTALTKIAMLNANNESLTITAYNYDQLFTEQFTKTSKVVGTETLNIYTHNTSNNISFEVVSTGYQAGKKTYSVLTLKSDFKTIVDITVTQHGERRASIIQTNENFFDGYVGKVFNPTIEVVSENANASNQVLDGFAGVTQTKDNFITALNDTYTKFKNAFGSEA